MRLAGGQIRIPTECPAPGSALFFAGRLEEAAQAYMRGLEVDPTNQTLAQGLESAHDAIRRGGGATSSDTSGELVIDIGSGEPGRLAV